MFKWILRVLGLTPCKHKPRRKYRHTTEADRERFKLLYKQGWTQKQIGMRTGFSTSTVSKHLPPVTNKKKVSLFQ